MSATVVGVVLTFAAVDGRTLQLTASLTEPATAAVAWGDLVLASTVARTLHRFRPLPAPDRTSIDYVLRAGHGGDGAIVRARVRPLPPEGPLRIAVLGDSRDGTGPRRLILAAIRASRPDVMVHTGDIVRTGAEDEAWRDYLRATALIGAEVPLVLALGNHEYIDPAHDPSRGGDGLSKRSAVRTGGPPVAWTGCPESDQLAKRAERGSGPPEGEARVGRTLAHMPPPDDRLAAGLGAPASAYRVRVGPALFVALDSNMDMSPGSPQLRFLEAALRDRLGARITFVAMHHGPLSSARHGGHPRGAALLGVMDTAGRETGGAPIVFAGHDHAYERLRAGNTSVIVSGGAGAPLYGWTRPLAASVAFASTYNWALVEVSGDRAELSAFGLEGVLLDRAELGEISRGQRGGGGGGGQDGSLLRVCASALLASVALAFVVARLVRR